MKTALLVIALGGDYRPLAKQLLESAKKYFIPHTPVVWSDDDVWMPEGGIKIAQRDLGFPQSTLQRYRMFYEQAGLLTNFDQVFYTDIDMKFVWPVDYSDVCSDGITATLHPGFVVQRRDQFGDIVGTCGTPEYRKISTAAVPYGVTDQYFCGGFNGGDAKTFLRMADTLRQNIDKDTENNIIAKWHDESHLNKYLYENPPAKVLTPSFCYPEDYAGQYGWAPDAYRPVLVALDKRKIR